MLAHALSPWDHYLDQMRRQRLIEATILWNEVELAGLTPGSGFIVEFVHLGGHLDDCDGLMAQLSDKYRSRLSPARHPFHSYVRGTSRPDLLHLTRETHAAWVQGMADLSAAFGCVFSGWQLEAPAVKRIFRSAFLEDL